jgi:cysteine synthase
MANLKLDYWVTGYGTWMHSCNCFISSVTLHANLITIVYSLLTLIRSLGTGGTFHGAGKYIKEHCPNTKIILAEPGAAAIVGSGIKTERNADGSPQASHPAFQSHPIQGERPEKTIS